MQELVFNNSWSIVIEYISIGLLQFINEKKLEATLKAQKIISKIFFNQS